MKKNISLYLKNNKLVLALLIIIIFIGFYLRVDGVISNSFAYTYDVGRDLLQVQKIVKEHKIPLIGQTTGLGGLYYGPWWYYIITLPFLISGGNPQGIAFFMVLIGIVTIILGFILGFMLGGKWLGLIFSLFISFSNVTVGLSSQIWNPNIAPPLLVLLLILLFRKFKNKKIEFIRSFFIGVLLGLIIDAEIVFGALLIGGVVLSIIYLKKKNDILRSMLGIIVGFIFTLLPRIVFEIRHDFVMTRSLFITKSADQKIFDIQNIFSALPGRLQTFLSQFSETFGVNIVLGTIILMLLMMILFVRRKNITNIQKNMLTIIGIIVSVFILGSGIFAREIWGHYLVALPILYIIFASISLYILSKRFLLLGVLLTLILAIISMRPISVIAELQNPHWEGNAAVYRNQIAIIDYIYKDARGKQFNCIAYTPVVHDYTYQYLFSWYGQNKYGYLPKTSKESLFYVIIEPDPGFEGRIVDWLKIREGDGKVLKEKVIKGGIKVQQRVH